MSSLGVYENLEKCEERSEADFYPTPWEATEALCRAERSMIQGKNVLEPACGNGAISKHLEQNYGCTVISTDLKDRGYGQGGIDFITAKETFILPQNFARECLITNPPFNIAEKFLRRAHGLNFAYMAFLLKSTYFHAKTRLPLFNEMTPSRIYPLGWRVDFTGKNQNHFETCWFVWDKSYSGQNTLYMKPLQKPKNTNQKTFL